MVGGWSHPSVDYKRGLDFLIDGNWVELNFHGNMEEVLFVV